MHLVLIFNALWQAHFPDVFKTEDCCYVEFMWLVIALIGVKLAAQVYLAWLNRRHVLAHAGDVPASFRDIVDLPTYKKSVTYTLAKDRLNRIQMLFDAVVLAALLFSGVLPQIYDAFPTTVWMQTAFLVAVGLGLTALSLPWDWYAQFQLEERFGFNTSTQRTWWLDRLKGLMIALNSRRAASNSWTAANVPAIRTRSSQASAVSEKLCSSIRSSNSSPSRNSKRCSPTKSGTTREGISTKCSPGAP